MAEGPAGGALPGPTRGAEGSVRAARGVRPPAPARSPHPGAVGGRRRARPPTHLRRRWPPDADIRWLGYISEEEKVRRLVAADVLCAPSLGQESFGVVLLEAMAARTVVVASDLPGYRDAAGSCAVLVTARPRPTSSPRHWAGCCRGRLGVARWSAVGEARSTVRPPDAGAGWTTPTRGPRHSRWSTWPNATRPSSPVSSKGRLG